MPIEKKNLALRILRNLIINGSMWVVLYLKWAKYKRIAKRGNGSNTLNRPKPIFNAWALNKTYNYRYDIVLVILKRH